VANGLHVGDYSWKAASGQTDRVARLGPSWRSAIPDSIPATWLNGSETAFAIRLKECYNR
jgi:hypothetical protein